MAKYQTLVLTPCFENRKFTPLLAKFVKAEQVNVSSKVKGVRMTLPNSERYFSVTVVWVES